MYIKLFIIVVVIILALVLIFRFISANSGEEKELSKDLKITYNINSGIPFKWDYKIGNKNIVQFVRSYVTSDHSGEVIDGADVFVNYVFKGLKKGKPTIIFRCVSLGDNSIVREEKYNVVVDADMNISLLDNKDIWLFLYFIYNNMCEGEMIMLNYYERNIMYVLT